jgi:phosphatidylglycerol lysyltransferase
VACKLPCGRERSFQGRYALQCRHPAPAGWTSEIAVFAAARFFRSVADPLVASPRERERAQQLLSEFGGSSYGHFQTAPDKSFFFSPSGRSFVAYRVFYHAALALGDPVGPAHETGEAASAFVAHARENGWTAAFLMPDRVSSYRELGLSVLKIGEEAVVDLDHFATVTSNGRRFRYIKRKLGGEGYACERFPPPHPPELLDEAEDVSREWLGLPHHREYGFHQGCFDREVLIQTPIFGLREPGGRLIAFVSQVPSYRAGEAKGDLMRRRPGIHCRGMDLVFTEMLLCLRDEGYRTFNLGLAPFAGVGESADSPLLERIMHVVGSRVGWLAGLGRLRQYKSKFEPAWEDRFLVYDRGLLALPRIGLAMTRSL